MSQPSTKKASGISKSPNQAKADAVDKARQLAPGLAARIGSTPQTMFRGDADIFGRLVEDHDLHRALLAMIEETDPVSPERPKLFEELARELKSHAAAEEQALWSAVLRNPDTTDFARHAIAEHKDIDDMLADLAARDIRSPVWMERFGGLKAKYLHHIREEEQEQFLEAEKTLTDTNIQHMRSVFEKRKSEEKATVIIEKKISLKD